jgi:hypothetical protein
MRDFLAALSAAERRIEKNHEKEKQKAKYSDTGVDNLRGVWDSGSAGSESHIHDEMAGPAATTAAATSRDA